MPRKINGCGQQVFKYIKYETDDEGIAKITLTRPKVNAFNLEMSFELRLALDSFACRKEEKVLILTGEGNYFSTGEDLKNINLDATIPDMRKYTEETLGSYHKIIQAILLTTKPIIAALNGVAAGAGMSIVLACDYRVIETKDVSVFLFIPAFVDVGLVPDCGMMLTLPRLVGDRKARELTESRNISISRPAAVNLGLVEVANPIKLAKSLMESSLLALGFSKQARNQALIYELNRRIFPWELKAQANCLASDEFREKVQKFLSKPKARKKKR